MLLLFMHLSCVNDLLIVLNANKTKCLNYSSVGGYDKLYICIILKICFETFAQLLISLDAHFKLIYY